MEKIKAENIFAEAAALFEQYQYEQAFDKFRLAYEAGYADVDILQVLQEAYYEPNEEELRTRYANNQKLFAEYPYIFRRDQLSFDTLPLQFFPQSEQQYAIFDKTKQIFQGVYTEDDSERVPYFFENLDQPLLLGDVYNGYHLRYLRDNVRLSEYIGADNHIYLYYHSWETFCAYWQVIDWSALLAEKQFVFLFGDEEKAKYYPLDFKGLYQIDYARMPFQPIQIHEIKRLILEMQVLCNCGNEFLNQVVDWHEDLLTMPYFCMSEFGFFYEQTLQGKTVEAVTAAIQKMFKQPLAQCFEKMCLMYMVLDINRGNKNYLKDLKLFLDALRKVCPPKTVLTKKEWLIAFYLAYAEMHRRDMGHERIVPAIFHSVHFVYIHTQPSYEKVKDMIEEFPYKMRLTIIRDPITAMASDVEMLYKGNDTIKKVPVFPNIIDWLLDGNEGISISQKYYKPPQGLLAQQYMLRFEDMKLNTRATLTALAEYLNIPLSQRLFQTTDKGKVIGHGGRDGFDPAPIYKKRPEMLNEFDCLRLEMVIGKYYEPFGYKPKLYDGMRYTNEQAREMLAIPFRFEVYCTEVPKEIMEECRRMFIERAMLFYRENFKEVPYKGLKPIEIIWPKEELLENPLYE